MSFLSAAELESANWETDTAIIGAGAAGLAVASRLTGRVTVIESGNFEIDRKRQEDFAAVVTGEPVDCEYPRIRIVGGATALWSGRCAPLDEADFADRPWMGAPGWPIARASLDEWYDEAWRFLRVDRARAPARAGGVTHDGWFAGSSDLRLQRWHYSFARPEVARRLREDHLDSFHGADKTLICDAECVDLVVEGGRAVSATIVDRGGRRLSIRASRFVVCSGCIEVNRLMLVLARAEGSAVAGLGDWIGRGFQQHLRVDCGEVAGGRAIAARLQKVFNRFHDRPGRSIELGLALRPSAVMRERVSNASLTFRYNPDLPRAMIGAPSWLLSKLRGREPQFAFAKVRVEADVEQATDRASRITLADVSDRNGVPRAEVHWKINQVERRTAVFAARAVDRLLRDGSDAGIADIGRLEPADVGGERLTDSLHHLGGTRMSAGPDTGVVDANCKVHGTENLFIVGGSVFAAGGHANPTLTIIALALRLAEHLNILRARVASAVATRTS